MRDAQNARIKKKMRIKNLEEEGSFVKYFGLNSLNIKPNITDIKYKMLCKFCVFGMEIYMYNWNNFYLFL